jgi:chemotaxis protein histidine kinase CheA
MTEGPGFLEFFILEAGEYVEQLDGLLLAGGSSGPDPDALQRVARALRGTATMAKLPAFADLAAAIERVGRALHDHTLAWDQSLRGALVAAVDDLKTLLHAARRWTSAEDRRASVRTAELSRLAPGRPSGGTDAGQPGLMAFPFLSTEAANIAAGLELLITRSSDTETVANVLRRIRALRGVAGVKEIVPLADALEATEAAGRVLESGRESLTPEARQLLENAAAYMRSLASALRMGGDVHAQTPAREAFDAAVEAWTGSHAIRDRVVPIATLFYTEGSGLVEAAAHPPTSAPERFRLELVSLGEHLRQVVNSTRATRDSGQRSRIQRELRRSLQALEAAAESFGEREIADFVRSHVQATASVDFLSMSALDDLASLLTEPGAKAERLRARLREVAGNRDMADAIGVGFGPATPSTPSIPVPGSTATHTPAAAPPRVGTPASPMAAAPPPPHPPQWPSPVGSPAQAPIAARRTTAATRAAGSKLDDAAMALIDSGISALESVAARPLIDQTPFDEDTIVPIESLLYRGRAALDRAVELRDQLRNAGPSADPETLDELYDLLELARAD